jgi:hypothetical protein
MRTKATGTAAKRRDAGRRRLVPRRRGARDAGYLAWLQADLPCIACLVRGVASATPIEAARQTPKAPLRRCRPAPDAWAVPLCRAHRRAGPLGGEHAEAQFWSLVGLSQEQTAAFCAALHTAYRHQRDGCLVIQLFASLAFGNRAAARADAPGPGIRAIGSAARVRAARRLTRRVTQPLRPIAPLGPPPHSAGV